MGAPKPFAIAIVQGIHTLTCTQLNRLTQASALSAEGQLSYLAPVICQVQFIQN